MEEPLTEELLAELLDAPSADAFLKKRESRLTARSLSEYLNQLIDERGLKRVQVIHAAGLNDTFGYQIFKGERGASRDTVLQLAFALQLPPSEIDHLLNSAGCNELYCKNRRDAIIIYAANHGYTLQQTDEELFRFGEETICQDA